MQLGNQLNKNIRNTNLHDKFHNYELEFRNNKPFLFVMTKVRMPILNQMDNVINRVTLTFITNNKL
jgi:hypothetical protein